MFQEYAFMGNRTKVTDVRPISPLIARHMFFKVSSCMEFHSYPGVAQ